jgi:DNA polymerase
MKTLSIDIESFSSVDLSQSGVYKYSESPDFEILLFGYSIDLGEVKVVDLANGEKIPQNIIDALTDDNVEKWAHNAAFERICLSRWLRDKGVTLDQFADNLHSAEVLGKAKYLNSESWRCSMVWAAYMGLPLSLEGVGKVLKLDTQKITEGKRLIRKFCIPPRVYPNSGIIPDADRELFKQYNKRDVETEMVTTAKLAKFPVPDSEWNLYPLDRKINDCGIQLDMSLLLNAITLDERSRSELMQKMQELTDLDNPNSAAQLKGWLAENGAETSALGKKSRC